MTSSPGGGRGGKGSTWGKGNKAVHDNIEGTEEAEHGKWGHKRARQVGPWESHFDL